MRPGWKATSRLTAVHESGRAEITLVPVEPGRNGRHFLVKVDGDWIMQSSWIKPFYSLDKALNAAETILARTLVRRVTIAAPGGQPGREEATQ